MNRDFSVLCSCLWAAAATLLYALLAFGVLFPPDYPYFGTDIYDAYFYRLMDGRFDLPMRMLRYEGHYATDGTGVLYHGVAPLLTRALLHPFVTLGQFPTAAFSIWLWAVVGTGIYHLSIFQVMRKFAGPRLGYSSIIWATLTSLGIWICGPGLLLSSNLMLYHEPISIAYAAMAVAVYLMMRCALFDMRITRVLIPLAIIAGILLHSRPHMAVGLYVGVAILAGLALWPGSRRSIAWVTGSLAILAIFAISFLQLNTARFGAMTKTHGQFGTNVNEDTIQYGPVFWGAESADSLRAAAFREHGTFHPWRTLPNLVVYTLDYPIAEKSIVSLHRKVTQQISGYSRFEEPRVGMIFLWPAWVILVLVGLGFGRPRLSGGRKALPIIVTTGVAAGLMLSYPTIAFRYRFDLWPLVIVLCLLSFPGLMRRFDPTCLEDNRVLKFSFVILMAGMLISGQTVKPYASRLQTKPDEFYETWNAEKCGSLVRARGLSAADETRLCIDPETIYSHDFEG